MDVRLSDEQRALADGAEQVVAKLGPHSVGSLDDVERRAKLDAAVAATGWLELRTPSEDGSPWGSGVEVGIVAEALGAGSADTAFIGPTLAAELRRRAGAAASEVPETVVLCSGLSDLAVVRDDGSVPGAALAIDVAADGSTALALSRAGNGAWSLTQVWHGAAGHATDLTRLSAPAGGQPAAAVEGAGTLGGDDLAAWRALGLAAACADLVGTMSGGVRLATEYAIDRSQYGRQIGSFQAVQHLLADALVLTEGSRSVARHAAWAVDALDPHDALDAAWVAKAYCARAARTVCETVIQVHGGIGNTWECMAHVQLRRALLSSDLLGGVGLALDRVLAARGIDEGSEDGLR